ncbi:MAG TPA: DUF6438 domain-containing protein [Polyangiaceae bacterium]|nr:DUF6438 domain-containing protein [Polyangiaceae bacterium]
MRQALRNSRRWVAWLLACAALASLPACGKKKKAAADTTSIDQPHPPDTVPGATAVATLERTGCYGECPVYRLTVNSDGSVVYVGTRWVKVLGRQVYKISDAQLSELQASFDRAGFSQLRDYDKVESTDDDWALLSYRRGAGFKRVRHYHGDNSAPPALSTLEDEFDRIVDSGRLVGVPTATGAPNPVPPALPSAAASAPAGPGEATPTPSAKPPHPSDNVGPPDETTADPDNHP